MTGTRAPAGCLLAERFALLGLVLLVACRAPSSTPVPAPAASAAPSASARVASPTAAATTPVPAPASSFHGREIRLPAVHDGVIDVPSPRACIPPAELAGEAALPVLYVTDGDYFLDALDLCGVVETLAREDRIEPWIVVGLPSTEAREDVLARHPESLAERVADTIEPALAAQVHLAHGRRRRAVLGYSYGGLASIRMALAAPDRFGRVLAMSPSLWWNERAVLAAFEHAERVPARMYLDVGSAEGGHSVVPPMVADVRSLAALAIDRGMRFGRELSVREVMGHAHDMRLAASRLPGALVLALGDVDRSRLAPAAITFAVYPRASPTTSRTFAIQARYTPDVVLTWPPALADARLEGRPLSQPRLPRASTATLSATIAGVSASLPLE